jgi:hypothetical protein
MTMKNADMRDNRKIIMRSGEVFIRTGPNTIDGMIPGHIGRRHGFLWVTGDGFHFIERKA